ncbi:unnamed protein product [Calicophoron daubneyi]|uniref:Coiled-coil domain-containing protein 146 n=1 Tax=Calicophoron daubneyi TaxID=300641 RepID=A0AAV2TIT4_CALDB
MEEAERLRDESIVEFERLRAELENLQACRSRLELEREKLGAQSAKKQRKIFDTQAQYDAVSLQLDLAQQKAAELALEKTEAELRLGHLASEASRVAEAIKRHTRLRDETLRMLKKSQHNVQACKDAVRFAQANCTEKKATCLNLKQLGRDRELVVKRKKLNQEVSKLKEEVIYRSKLSETEREELLKSIQAQSQLNFTLADLRVEVVELSRLAAIKADEREQKSRDFRTAESRYRRIKDEIRTKQLQIEDYERALHDIQRRLKDFAALYESIKEERNNCLTLIQYGHQRLQEISEKLRIRRNEVEILEDTLTQKTQQIERQRAKCTIIVNARNELRNQISKQACLIEDYEAERDKLQISIQSQNRVVQKNKEALAFIKDAMGRVIEIRNKRAVQMVERNEELCVLQEKLRLQELTLSKGETEFGSLNEQIKWLEQERVELIRSIEVCRRKNGKQKELEDELTSRQIQLAICEDQVANLSKAVVDPTAPMLDPETGEPVRPDVVKIDQTRLLNESSEQLRVRQVAGRERNPADLRMKIDGIQLQILNREKKLLEFDLLLQAVSRLVKKLQSQAGVEGDTTLQLAKTMNANYNQVQETNKELKASTAEMTMLMAMAFKLQRMVEKKREYVAECQRRIEAGETPSEELMLEWKRYMKRRKQKLIEDQEQTQDTDSDENWTTAPERPNAYVPEQSTAELVEIKPTAPLPYGAHPPFRPTTPGANMRHFRNPKQKELE